MNLDPTGARVSLSLERDDHIVSAEITAVGASLRALTVDGVDCIARYPDGIPAPGASGVVLVPWPNRVRDGRWELNGTTQQLALTEPAKHNASHGLLRYVPYLWSQADSAVTLRNAVFPQPGYPFTLETSVTYALTVEGITVTHSIRNASDVAAPVAIGAHPYLALGDTPATDLTLTSSGTEVFVTDERSIPIGLEPVSAANDLRAGRNLAELELDTAYTGFTREADGYVRHRLRDRQGRTVTLWQDSSFEYAQFFTNRKYPGRDVTLACEPMTAPANALNSGTGLRWLEPEESLHAVWGVFYSGTE